MMASAFDISSSALVAQRVRLNAISSNIANMSTMRNEDGQIEPYQARYVVFQTDEEVRAKGDAMGVKVSSVEIESVEPNYRFDPTHPMSIKSGPRKGYVAYPNVDMNTEFVDALQAVRAYEANIGVMEITKNMSQQSLRIIG